LVISPDSGRGSKTILIFPAVSPFFLKGKKWLWADFDTREWIPAGTFGFIFLALLLLTLPDTAASF